MEPQRSQGDAAGRECEERDLTSSFAFIVRLRQKLAVVEAQPLRAGPLDRCTFCAFGAGKSRVTSLLRRMQPARDCSRCDFLGHYSQ